MTQDEIIEMARQAGCFEKHQVFYFTSPELEAFANLVKQQAKAEEREACAKIADQYVGQDLEHNFSALVAHNIRARGQA